ncbi:MAG: TldD/PmbA family protein [bacterium]
MPVAKDLAKNILRNAKAVADEAEVYICTREQLKIDVMDQNTESVDNITDGGLALRLIKNKKMGFAYTADLDEHSIETLIGQALDISTSAASDENFGFPAPKAQTAPLTLVEADISGTKLEDKLKLALDIEKAAYSFDKRIKKSEKISYQDSISTTVLVNSKGVDITYQKAVCGAFAEVIAEDNGLMETGSWLQFSTAFNSLDAKYIGEEAAKRAALMLGAKQEKSGRSPVILSPYVASTLVSAISPALSAEYVQKGKSLFTGAIDKRVASIKFNLIDSGILKNGVSSVPYDDEGIPTRGTIVIKDGCLRSFLQDSYTAKKGKTSSTANSFRSSFKSQPEIQPTNLYVQPGFKSQEEMISGSSKGFLVTNIMGAHTINPISGDFSIGFSGFLIENGKISRPVRGMTIAGNILDVFNHIDEIGSDLMFFPHNGSIGAPSILIFGLSVSGI